MPSRFGTAAFKCRLERHPTNDWQCCRHRSMASAQVSRVTALPHDSGGEQTLLVNSATATLLEEAR
jgi:hypothetical protein